MGATNSREVPHLLSTPRGQLRGVEVVDNDSNKPICRRYAAVRYALPPVGERRWRRPMALPRDWSFSSADGSPGDYGCFGPICPQVFMGSVAVPNDRRTERPLVQDEDCLRLNIWVPADAPPEGGWPVQFDIHGGMLQCGNAMQTSALDPVDLYRWHAGGRRVIVSPAYRLNVFGFLACAELGALGEEPAPGNFGLWDVRMALEWTHANIALFGGAAGNITVGGLSPSTVHQLHYDAFQPDPSRRLIRRAFLLSAAVAGQPDAADGPQRSAQFDELCARLCIAPALPAQRKLALLRATPAAALVRAVAGRAVGPFKAATDAAFVPAAFMASVHDGSLARRLAAAGVAVLLGDVADEAALYRFFRARESALFRFPRAVPDRAGLLRSLGAFFAPPAARALVALHGGRDWADRYARIMANAHVHAAVRGFARSLLAAMPPGSVHRYRLAWRAPGLDAWLHPDTGVCHAAEIPVWWLSGCRAGFEPRDRETCLAWLEPFGAFLRGDAVDWGTTSPTEVRLLDSDGSIRIVQDDFWDAGLEVWDAMKESGGSAKL
ncbi:Carboxylesterase type B [Macrophomina phaseolina MS6]|uniref:Carboxylesterase type B n=1 Tax=Macrophomina phaseolina (strain MS6) TaxID=1126212 RepID=K2RTY0_MACPH|nr:Carboxylesterase type B [Macrophomina phaseolina MS6]